MDLFLPKLLPKSTDLVFLAADCMCFNWSMDKLSISKKEQHVLCICFTIFVHFSTLLTCHYGNAFSILLEGN